MVVLYSYITDSGPEIRRRWLRDRSRSRLQKPGARHAHHPIFHFRVRPACHVVGLNHHACTTGQLASAGAKATVVSAGCMCNSKLDIRIVRKQKSNIRTPKRTLRMAVRRRQNNRVVGLDHLFFHGISDHRNRNARQPLQIGERRTLLEWQTLHIISRTQQNRITAAVSTRNVFKTKWCVETLRKQTGKPGAKSGSSYINCPW